MWKPFNIPPSSHICQLLCLVRPIWHVIKCYFTRKYIKVFVKYARHLYMVIEYVILRPAYTGRLPADLLHATQMNMGNVPQTISKLNNYGTFTHIHSSCMRQVGRKSPRVCRPLPPLTPNPSHHFTYPSL